MKKVRIGVVGLGRLGSLHAQIYASLKNVELACVCDIDKEQASSIGKTLKKPVSTQYQELITKNIDAVSIVTPTFLHYKIAKFFLQNKIHVLIEKLTPRPRFIEVHRLGPFTPRVKDVGVVLDLMIHDIDIVLGLTKSKIRDIQAVGMKILTKHEDIANARIRFKNGTVCDLTASRVTNDSMRKIRIFQKDCYISLDYVTQEAIISRKIKKKIVSKKIDIKKEAPLKKELLAFIDCVRNKKRPVVSGEEAYRALAVAHKIIRKIHR